MRWKQWLHGLLAAFVGSIGTIGGAGLWGFARDYDLTDWNFWEPLLGSALLSGWAAVQLYIRQFPPPGTLKPQERPAGRE